MITAPDRTEATPQGNGAPASDVAERLARARERIAAAASRAGRDPLDVRLVVVTKDVPAERVREALEAGATDLGENRAKELLAKQDALTFIAPEPRWHFIGTLQRNKARLVSGRVALIHSIDSIGVGRAVASRALGGGTTQDVLLEVNVSGEPTKHGFAPDALPAALERLKGEGALKVRGLMTIAPAGSPERARAAFRDLRVLRDRLRETADHADLVELSMGMTSDFEEAIAEGATIVRLGTAIFGGVGA